MQRRQFIFALSSAAVLIASRAFAGETTASNKVTIMQFSDDGKPLGHATLSKIRKDAEWRKVLSPFQWLSQLED